MSNLLKKLFRKKVTKKERTDIINTAKSNRQQAEARIDSIIAQVNGCGDRWFLRPETSIDECLDNGDAH